MTALIIVLVIIGLSLLILGHEAGHFFVAKLLGLKVDEFGIGFPPRITAKKFGETEYSINWLPFGGFVRIGGERGEFEVIDPEGGAPAAASTAPPQATDADKARLFYNQPAWKKSLIVLAGVFMNFILGWLFIAIVFMVGVPQTLVISGTQTGSPAATAGIQAGDVVKGYTDAQSFINYIDANKGQSVTFDTLFPPGALQQIFPIVQSQLETQTGLTGSISPADGLDPAHYQNFAITDDAVVFYFGQGELLPSDAGATSASVPRTALPPLQL